MRKEVQFLIYCIEQYKIKKDLSGKDVVALFGKYRVNDFIIDYYEALHTTSVDYIINDIDEYIDKMQIA